MFTNSYSGDKLEKNEMGGAYSAYGGERGIYGVLVRERDHLEEPGVDGRIILRWNFRKWAVGYDLD